MKHESRDEPYPAELDDAPETLEPGEAIEIDLGTGHGARWLDATWVRPGTARINLAHAVEDADVPVDIDLPKSVNIRRQIDRDAMALGTFPDITHVSTASGSDA